MTEEVRRGEIPSYRDATTGKGKNSQPAAGKQNAGLVLGATWQASRRGKFLPCAEEKPQLVIPPSKLERYRRYMKDHAMICKFVGVWPSENDLTRWIQQNWQPLGHIELKLGAKGFFMVIFSNPQDKERVFDNGPYFYYNAGLFMRYWQECYNPDKEKNLASPVWVRLFGLPMDFWDPEILEGIENTIASFVTIAETTKKGRHTSYARICVYMNIANPIPDTLELEYHEEVWQKTLDLNIYPLDAIDVMNMDTWSKSAP